MCFRTQSPLWVRKDYCLLLQRKNLERTSNLRNALLTTYRWERVNNCQDTTNNLVYMYTAGIIRGLFSEWHYSKASIMYNFIIIILPFINQTPITHNPIIWAVRRRSCHSSSSSSSLLAAQSQNTTVFLCLQPAWNLSCIIPFFRPFSFYSPFSPMKTHNH